MNTLRSPVRSVPPVLPVLATQAIPPDRPVQAAGQDALPLLVRALLRPETYPHAAGAIRLLETHISWVVLAGRYAYKVKKPVNFGFLDFSTRERREAACAEEVRLNRRLCPRVYLGVRHVVRRDGNFVVVGTGVPFSDQSAGQRSGQADNGPHSALLAELADNADGALSGGADGQRNGDSDGEPVVWMRRLPEEGMLPRLLARGTADGAQMRRIARRLALFHAAAGTRAGVDELGSPEVIAGNWEQNFAQTAHFPPGVLPARNRRAIVRYVHQTLIDQQDLFQQRAANGRIREGHGDLHAANVCIGRQSLHLFDCIEFDARFRCADVAAEVAFLAMDLDHFGRADLGAAFVDAYVRQSGDVGVRELLAFYKCYRAYVRGKVTGFRLAEPGLSRTDRARLSDEARAYFDLAWAYARYVPGPALIAVMGVPASGKTTLAHALASHLGLVHLSSDVLRKQMNGLAPRLQRREAFGSGIYTAQMTRRTYAALRRRAATWVRAGQSVVLDATFGQAGERSALCRLASRLGVPLIWLVCWADEATLRRRITARAVRPDGASDARLELWPALRAAYQEPAELPDVVEVDTTQSMRSCVEQVISTISTHWRTDDGLQCAAART